MKLVRNACYGGFGISKEASKILKGVDLNRGNKKFISLIEEKGSEFVSDDYAELEIVNIPDEATDWDISDYDGMETIIYVLNGKICYV